MLFGQIAIGQVKFDFSDAVIHLTIAKRGDSLWCSVVNVSKLPVFMMDTTIDLQGFLSNKFIWDDNAIPNGMEILPLLMILPDSTLAFYIRKKSSLMEISGNISYFIGDDERVKYVNPDKEHELDKSQYYFKQKQYIFAYVYPDRISYGVLPSASKFIGRNVRFSIIW